MMRRIREINRRIGEFMDSIMPGVIVTILILAFIVVFSR